MAQLANSNGWLGFKPIGFYGQAIMIFPDLDIVAVKTGREFYPLDEFVDLISGAVKSDASLPADAAGAKLLANKILEASTEKPAPVGSASKMAASVSGKVYRFPPNPLSIKSVSLRLTDPQPRYDVEYYAIDTTKPASRFAGPIGFDGQYQKGEPTYLQWLAICGINAVKGSWLDDHTYDKRNMQKHGQLQYEKATELFGSPSVALSGSIDVRHTHVDMSCVVIENAGGARTWPAALGLSFAAGSREDGVPKPDVGLKEGITNSDVKVTELWLNMLASTAGFFKEGIPTALDFRPEFVAGHSPKPILFALGAREGLAPKVLPIQILKIGQLVIAGFPGEISTMAGRRLRDTILNELKGTDVKYLAMAAYANDYWQYVTTKEEYDMQHYEGASNLFGPFTLHAYQQEFRKLAIALRTGNQVGPGPLPPTNSSPRVRQWRFRNQSRKDVEVKLYNTGDTDRTWTLPNGTQTIRAHTEVAFPERAFTGLALPTVAVAKAFFNGTRETTVGIGVRVTIDQDVIEGAVSEGGGVGGYQGG